MMNLVKKKPSTIDEYLANVKPHHRKTLQQLRQTIQTAAPNVEECISYGLPAFRLNRRVLVFLARGQIIARFTQVMPPR